MSEPTLLSDDRLEEIRAREGKVKPGPWRVVTDDINMYEVVGFEWQDYLDSEDFLSSARQDIPDLLSHISAQDAQLEGCMASHEDQDAATLEVIRQLKTTQAERDAALKEVEFLKMSLKAETKYSKRVKKERDASRVRAERLQCDWHEVSSWRDAVVERSELAGRKVPGEGLCDWFEGLVRQRNELAREVEVQKGAKLRSVILGQRLAERGDEAIQQCHKLASWLVNAEHLQRCAWRATG